MEFIKVEAPRISAAYLGRKITVNAFRARFSLAESVDFETKLTNSPTLRVLDKRLQALVATHVDLDDPTYANEAMPALISAGILTESRAAEIMTSPVQWKELTPLAQQFFVQAGYQIDV